MVLLASTFHEHKTKSFLIQPPLSLWWLTFQPQTFERENLRSLPAKLPQNQCSIYFAACTQNYLAASFWNNSGLWIALKRALRRAQCVSYQDSYGGTQIPLSQEVSVVGESPLQTVASISSQPHALPAFFNFWPGEEFCKTPKLAIICDKDTASQWISPSIACLPS